MIKSALDDVQNCKEESHYERESDASVFDALYGPHKSRTRYLNDRENVYVERLDMSQVNVVGLILCRHEENQHSLYELWNSLALMSISVYEWSSVNNVFFLI